MGEKCGRMRLELSKAFEEIKKILMVQIGGVKSGKYLKFLFKFLDGVAGPAVDFRLGDDGLQLLGGGGLQVQSLAAAAELLRPDVVIPFSQFVFSF